MDQVKRFLGLYDSLRMTLEKIDTVLSRYKTKDPKRLSVYQKSRIDETRKSMLNDIMKMKELFRSDAAKELKEKLGSVNVTIIYKQITQMEGLWRNEDYEKLKGLTDEMAKYIGPQASTIKKEESTINVETTILVDDESSSAMALNALNLPTVPVEIKPILDADFSELKRCFHAGCFRSTIILCGRILEVALFRKLFDITGNDLMETAPGMGLGKVIGKLKELNVNLPPGINEQIHLINNTRIYSVHVKNENFTPSREKTHAIVLFTFDVLRHTFKR